LRKAAASFGVILRAWDALDVRREGAARSFVPEMLAWDHIHVRPHAFRIEREERACTCVVGRAEKYGARW
jgi:hypothetical protein